MFRLILGLQNTKNYFCIKQQVSLIWNLFYDLELVFGFVLAGK